METTREKLQAGLALHRRGQLQAAEQHYRDVLAQQPDHPEALHLLGAVALQSGRGAEAVELLTRAAQLWPDAALVHINLAMALAGTGRLDEALATLDGVRGNEGEQVAAQFARATILEQAGQLDEALCGYRRCMQQNPRHAPALCALGDLLRQLGQLDEAMRRLDEAIALQPHFADAHYKRGLVLLSLGRLGEGFTEYEWRLRHGVGATRTFQEPRWDGTPLGKRTLLVYAEQGLGDTLQFVRYLPLLRRHGRVLFEAPRALVPLVRQSGYDDVIAAGDALPPFDVQLPLLSVPHVLRTELDTIPAAVPYLAADAARVESWRNRLSGYDGYQVGIAWQGSPTQREDRWRSVPLAAFRPLAEVPGVRLVSLQQGPGIEQISALQDDFHVVNLGSETDAEGAFLDTAAIVENLDLVISVDTALAHLAGGLGAACWVALRYSPDWRWLGGREDSPWYPTLRLFRQGSFGQWDAIFRAMSDELLKRVTESTG